MSDVVLCYCSKVEFQKKRLVEQPRLEGTSENHQVQPSVEKGSLEIII